MLFTAGAVWSDLVQAPEQGEALPLRALAGVVMQTLQAEGADKACITIEEVEQALQACGQPVQNVQSFQQLLDTAGLRLALTGDLLDRGYVLHLSNMVLFCR